MAKMMDGGKFLVHLRKICGLSQLDIAKKMNMARALVSRLENNKRTLTKLECNELAQIYEIPSEVFLKAYNMALRGENPFVITDAGDTEQMFSFEDSKRPLDIRINYPQASNFIVLRDMAVANPQEVQKKKMHPLLKWSLITAIVLLVGLVAFISILGGAILPEMDRIYLKEHPGAKVAPITMSFAEFLQVSALYFILLFCLVAIEIIVYFTVLLIRKYKAKKTKKENIA